MWDAAGRHPARTLLLFALSSLIVVDGTRRTLAGHDTAARPAPLIACIIFALGAIPLSVFIRVRPEFTHQRTQALLAVAYTPIVLAVAAVAFGAASWLPWASFALGVALATWWATDRKRSSEAMAVEQPEGRPSC